MGPAGEEGEEAGPSQQATAAGEEQQQQQQNPFGFPLSLVKRIMCMDPDVARISGAAFAAIAAAPPHSPCSMWRQPCQG